jgi:hypothetical protein
MCGEYIAMINMINIFTGYNDIFQHCDKYQDVCNLVLMKCSSVILRKCDNQIYEKSCPLCRYIKGKGFRITVKGTLA